MFHMNWSERRGRRGNPTNPFEEMEMEMSSFRNNARSFGTFRNLLGFEDSSRQQLDEFLEQRMSNLPVMPSRDMSRDMASSQHLGRVEEQDMFNVMMTAFQPLFGQSLPGQSLPGQSLPGQSLPGRALLDDVMDTFTDSMSISNHHGRTRQRPRQGPRRHPGNRRQQEQDAVQEVFHHPHRGRVDPYDREMQNIDFANRNTYPFPQPNQDRRVWYDPEEPVPEDRLPQIPARFLTLAQIGRIPTRKITGAEGSCDICLEDYQQGDVSKVLNCRHDYHVTCVDPWLKQHTTCPKCRRQVRAPPENCNRPPRPPPPPCPMRERARAYDRERRARLAPPRHASSGTTDSGSGTTGSGSGTTGPEQGSAVRPQPEVPDLPGGSGSGTTGPAGGSGSGTTGTNTALPPPHDNSLPVTDHASPSTGPTQHVSGSGSGTTGPTQHVSGSGSGTTGPTQHVTVEELPAPTQPTDQEP